MLEDKLLYKNFLDGDNKSFENLIMKYKNNLIYFINRYTKNIDISEDIFQEVILFILENKNYYDFNYSFKTYMYMIAKSKAINWINKRIITDNLDDKEEIKDEKLLEEIILNKERKKKIEKVLNKMPLEYQIVIYLTKIEELSYKETAVIMNKKETQIKKLSYNARRKMRKLLIEEKVIEVKNGKIIKLFVLIMLIGVISSGIALAKSIIDRVFFGGSKGFDSAINNNYIVNPESDFILSNGIGLKIENLVMDDTYLGINFNLKYNSDISDLTDIVFEKIIIYDENNCILYCNNKNLFKNFCQNKKLPYIWENCDDYNINSGLSVYNIDHVNCIYNLYAVKFPKSKKIFVNIENIIDNSEGNKIINGNWNLDIELTKEMYNREVNSFYTTDNIDNIEIKSIEVSKTNTKINLHIKSDVFSTITENESYIKKLIEQGKSNEEIANLLDQKSTYLKDNNLFKNVYIENLLGEKYYQDFNLPEGNNYVLYSDSNVMDMTFTLNLTEFDCTDIMYFYFELDGEKYKIELIKK